MSIIQFIVKVFVPTDIVVCDEAEKFYGISPFSSFHSGNSR